MSKEPLQKPGTLEKEYFEKENEDAIARYRIELERKAAAQKKRMDLSGAFHINNESIGTLLEELGFNKDNAAALLYLPLIDIAWADGKMTAKENRAIRKHLLDADYDKKSQVYLTVASWLSEKPATEFFEQAHKIIAAILENNPVLNSKNLYERCLEIAKASGGFLGLTRAISPKEEQALKQMQQTLGL